MALATGLAGNAKAANVGSLLGKGISGGGQGSHVIVDTKAGLEAALCSYRGPNNVCIDTTPRVIEVVGTIDYTGSEGAKTSAGCYYDPRNPRKALLTIADPKNSCTGPGIVQQPISYDKVGTDPLLVGSNKTIIGHDVTATIKGRGLVLRHVENVIVRNLTITDINPAVIWGGDAVDLSDVKDVWIDHNTFSLVGRQMIVAHFGSAQNITISWNVFDGKNPYYLTGHYYNILFNTKKNTDATIVYNWFRDFSGRSPALHCHGSFHIYNNIFQNGNGQALEMYDAVQVLLEGNVFENVKRPIVKTGGQIFAPLQSNAWRTGCTAQLHRECEANRVTGSPNTDGFENNPAALGGFATLNVEVPKAVTLVDGTVRVGAGPSRSRLGQGPGGVQ